GLVVIGPVWDLVGCIGDLLGPIGVEQAELGVDAGGGALDAGKPVHHGHRDGLARDREVVHGLRCLPAPEVLLLLHAHACPFAVFRPVYDPRSWPTSRQVLPAAGAIAPRDVSGGWLARTQERRCSAA